MMWAWATLFRLFTDTNVYRTASVKIWKTRHKISYGHTDIFTVRLRNGSDASVTTTPACV